MESLTTAITALLGLAGTVLETILGNSVLALFFAIGILGAVIGVVRKLKRV